MDDLIPLSHRVVFAVLFGGLAGLSYISSLVRKHIALLTYALACAAILNVLAMGIQGEFDAGSVVALLLVIPIMNFLFYRWKFLLYANALLFALIVGVFTVSSPTLIEVLLFLISSAAISGVSFWFTRRLLSTEEKSATHEQMFQDLFRHSMESDRIPQSHLPILLIDGALASLMTIWATVDFLNLYLRKSMSRFETTLRC